jgi:hypothetical protein
MNPGRLVDRQIVRFNNLNSARGGTSVFRMVLNNCGNIQEVEHQIDKRFVRSERVDRVDHHDDLLPRREIYQKELISTNQDLWLGVHTDTQPRRAKRTLAGRRYDQVVLLRQIAAGGGDGGAGGRAE